jgi:hypothetical protein
VSKAAVSTTANLARNSDSPASPTVEKPTPRGGFPLGKPLVKSLFFPWDFTNHAEVAKLAMEESLYLGNPENYGIPYPGLPSMPSANGNGRTAGGFSQAGAPSPGYQPAPQNHAAAQRRSTGQYATEADAYRQQQSWQREQQRQMQQQAAMERELQRRNAVRLQQQTNYEAWRMQQQTNAHAQQRARELQSGVNYHSRNIQSGTNHAAQNVLQGMPKMPKAAPRKAPGRRRP